MSTILQKTAALTAALFIAPLMTGTTIAHAEPNDELGVWINLGSDTETNKCDKDEERDTNYSTIRDDYESEGRYSNLQIINVGHRNRNRRICKRSVVGIGYGTSKALARANAVQAWARESRKRYGRTYRLRDANLISAIRCQYTGNRNYGNYKQRNRRFDLPGEAGNPNHNWNCSVNAKPCFTKTVNNDNYGPGPRWKRQMCERYARKALRQQRRNIRLGCEYQGPKWHSSRRRHIRTCMRTPMYRNFRTIMRHQRRLRQCR